MYINDRKDRYIYSLGIDLLSTFVKSEGPQFRIGDRICVCKKTFIFFFQFFYPKVLHHVVRILL